ncbi:hypothetical protein E1B28_002689 [Marasmius oreades]|uniref:Uncharacterized protein n=1 Tax=Marasmius oreades TaxID=181124 RepID=A0A9P7RNJ7_9AGAR|nr:uncharacterized protein E1B28_002689 [Marasmius oreades]KAG7086757.1 hypothetical protein E1B28_002689 [Marasmius oreades]
MSQPTNFGETISNGIQDVAALLPLLGTEQCERHVGTALEKGYLYAAATPLSIFGSLGIVRTAFSTLLATTTRPFYGGSWLNDAGFGTSGSVSSMVTLVKDTQQYGAEVQLQRLMREQHIDDPELVAEIEWHGWRGRNRAHGLESPLALPWNVALILTSMALSLASISPYLYLIHENWGRATLWLFPILRSFGALLCVVAVQLALQIRIYRITVISLLLMKARKRYPLSIEEDNKDRDILLEMRLRNLRDELGDASDPEKHPDRLLQAEVQKADTHTLSQDAPMFFLQAILVAGMGMIVAGYIGCFNMVNRTNVEGGPYVWFGMETGLSVIRIALWGWNPPWDERNKDLTIRLALHSQDLASAPPVLSDSEPSPGYTGADKADAGQLVYVLPISSFPLITIPKYLSQLNTPSEFSWGWQRDKKDFFIVESTEDFLTAATPNVGPLPRLDMKDMKDISLYYAIVPDISGHQERKLLCMNVCRIDSKWASVSFFIDGDRSYTAFTSHSRVFPGTRALQVTLDNEVQRDTITVVDSQTLDLLVDYSFRLFRRMCTIDNSGDRLSLSWNVTLPSSLHSADNGKPIPLTAVDKEYIRVRQRQTLQGDYCMQRGNILLGVFQNSASDEWGLLLESAVMEAYLCVLEHRFVQSVSLSPARSRGIGLEWIRSMEDRVSLETEECVRRQKSTDPYSLIGYELTWDLLAQELGSLRRLPSDSDVLRCWNQTIAKIMDHPDQLSISELIGLPPLKDLERLTDKLLPLFVANGVPTQVYRNMITFLRTSLHRLRNTKAFSLYDRIDPYGPGSPEFSPPFTKIREFSENISRELSRQFDSVQMLEFAFWKDTASILLDVLHLLNSLPPSSSLTTMIFNRSPFGNEANQLMTSILQRHRQIMWALFDSCDHVDRAHIDRAIAANRQKWKEDARSGGTFGYSTGCDPSLEYRGDYEAATMYQQDVIMTDGADLVAIIYIPQPGKIVLNLSIKPGYDRVTLIATLTRSPSASVGETNNASQDRHARRFQVVSSDYPDFKPVSIGGFPELESGFYELRIRLVEEYHYLFREITIDFIARTDGEDSGEGVHDSEAVEGSEAREIRMLRSEGEQLRVFRRQGQQ